MKVTYGDYTTIAFLANNKFNASRLHIFEIAIISEGFSELMTDFRNLQH